MIGLIGASADWYLMRASGFVAMALLTVTVCLGVANLGRLAKGPWTRTVSALVHRNVSLLAVLFLAIHIATAIGDTYAKVGILSIVVPGVSTYDPRWIGLGALSLDLMVAVTVTSLLRSRLPARIWRAVHWTAYLCWPLALVHGIGSGTGTGVDSRSAWAVALYAALGALFLVAVAVRLRLRRTVQATPRPSAAKPAPVYAIAAPSHIRPVGRQVSGPVLVDSRSNP